MGTMVTVSSVLLVLFIQTAAVMSLSLVSRVMAPVPVLDVEPSSASTLAFVIDVTGSMSDDLEQVMEGTSRILSKTLSRKPSPVQNFVLVPFSDPEIGPVSITTDPITFQRELDKLSVGGGGDCPEMSMGAIKKALEVSLPRSFIYVFADASAKDYHLAPDVLKLVQERQSQVVFVMTGDCAGRSDPGYTVYEDIAATSSGQVFQLDSKKKVSEVLKWVEENLQAQKVHLLSSNHDGAQGNTWNVTFDPSLREVTVSLSGPAPQIELTDPLGRVVGVAEGLIELLNIPNSVRVVNLKSPGAGEWKLKVSSSGRHTLRVTALSDVDFRVGFSSAPTSDFSSTRERPIEGVPAHVLLKVTGLKPPGKISRAELLSASGGYLRSLSVPMPSDLGARGLWSLPGFRTPSQSFFIKVVGMDEEGHYFQRLSSVSYTNADPGKAPTTTSPTTQPTTEDHPLEIADLVCGPREIRVGLRLASLVSYRLDPFSGHLDERGCSNSTERDGLVWYRVDRQDDTCGNTLVQALTGLGRPPRASMYLFHYSNYTMRYPAGPVILPHGEDVHVGLSVEWRQITDRFVLLLDNCYATPSYSHNDSTPHFLIRNKCPSNREVRVDENGVSLQARFSAPLELPYLHVYLHCSLGLCDLTTSSCSPVCSGREPRSVSSTMDIKLLTIGPITWENVSEM